MNDFTLYMFVKMQALRQALKDEAGQDLVEYALIVALIALAAVLGMNVLATAINQAFSTVGSKLSGYTT
jgi:pilus assembly protein Flp/PilA